MSRVRVLGVVVAVAAVLAATSGCSDSEGRTAPTTRPRMAYGTAPKSATKFGLCSAYPVAAMKKLVGGGNRFRVLAPAAIGEKGDRITGEACAWERIEPGGNELSVRVEVVDYGTDAPGLSEKFDELKKGTIGAADLPGVGDAAFTSFSEETSLVQVRQDHYLITASSRSAGKLSPVTVPELTALAGQSFAKLP
jgi:hypothetical protein